MSYNRLGPGSGGGSFPAREEEARLIQGAKEGDNGAIGELYRRHVDAIYRYIWARVRDTTVAEDLTAGVFLKALEALPTYEPSEKPFLAWLYRVAYARVVDYWRQQERRTEVQLSETVPTPELPPDEYVQAQADWERAMEMIAQLTDDQQDVIILRFIGELSLSEVAETLGKTLGATKALQHRALAALARMLERQGGPS